MTAALNISICANPDRPSDVQIRIGNALNSTVLVSRHAILSAENQLSSVLQASRSDPSGANAALRRAGADLLGTLLGDPVQRDALNDILSDAHDQPLALSISYPHELHRVHWEMMFAEDRFLGERATMSRSIVWPPSVAWGPTGIGRIDSSLLLTRDHVPSRLWKRLTRNLLLVSGIQARAAIVYWDDDVEVGSGTNGVPSSFQRRADAWAWALFELGFAPSVHQVTSANGTTEASILRLLLGSAVAVVIGHGGSDDSDVWVGSDSALRLRASFVRQATPTGDSPALVIIDACRSATIPQLRPENSFCYAFDRLAVESFLGYLGDPEISGAGRIQRQVCRQLSRRKTLGESLRRGRHVLGRLPAERATASEIIIVGQDTWVRHQWGFFLGRNRYAMPSLLTVPGLLGVLCAAMQDSGVRRVVGLLREANSIVLNRSVTILCVTVAAFFLVQLPTFYVINLLWAAPLTSRWARFVARMVVILWGVFLMGLPLPGLLQVLLAAIASLCLLLVGWATRRPGRDLSFIDLLSASFLTVGVASVVVYVLGSLVTLADGNVSALQ